MTEILKIMTISQRVILLFLLLVSCQGSEPNDSEVCSTGGIEDGVQISSPRADRDAELLALWWSRSLSAPDDLYDEIHEDLKKLRLADSYLINNSRFTPKQSYDDIYISLKQGVTLANLACVNQKLRLSSYKKFWHADNYVYRLRFDTLFYPPAAVSAYLYNKAFVQTARVFVGGDMGLGNWNIFFWKYPARRTYLFHVGETDEDADEYFEYYSVTTSVTFVGSWREGTPEPPWLQEALQAKTRFDEERL